MRATMWRARAACGTLPLLSAGAGVQPTKNCRPMIVCTSVSGRQACAGAGAPWFWQQNNRAAPYSTMPALLVAERCRTAEIRAAPSVSISLVGCGSYRFYSESSRSRFGERTFGEETGEEYNHGRPGDGRSDGGGGSSSSGGGGGGGDRNGSGNGNGNAGGSSRDRWYGRMYELLMRYVTVRSVASVLGAASALVVADEVVRGGAAVYVPMWILRRSYSDEGQTRIVNWLNTLMRVMPLYGCTHIVTKATFSQLHALCAPSSDDGAVEGGRYDSVLGAVVTLLLTVSTMETTIGTQDQFFNAGGVELLRECSDRVAESPRLSANRELSRNVVACLGAILQKPPMYYTVVGAFGMARLRRWLAVTGELDMRLESHQRAFGAYTRTLAAMIAHLSALDHASLFLDGDGKALMMSLADVGDRMISYDLLCAVANLALTSDFLQFTYQMHARQQNIIDGDGGGDELYRKIVLPLKFSLDARIRVQVARTIANITSYDVRREAICNDGWIPVLVQWLADGTDGATKMTATLIGDAESRGTDMVQLRMCTLVALANVTANRELVHRTLDFMSIETILPYVHFAAKHEVSTQALRLLDNVTSVGAGGGDIGTGVFAEQLEESVHHLIRRVAQGMAVLREDGRDTTEGIAPILYSLNILANCAANSASDAAVILEPDVWRTVDRYCMQKDVELQRVCSRIVANMSVVAPDVLKDDEHACWLLDQWMKSGDGQVKLQAVRGISSLASFDLRGPKYLDGIYLLSPASDDVPMPVATSVAVPDGDVAREEVEGDTGADGAVESIGELSKPIVPLNGAKYDLDIVFIHGATGDPLTTWVTAPTATPEDEARGDYVAWPRDWLWTDLRARDINARILSVGYEAEVSKWMGEALPLAERSTDVLEKLKLAQVGDQSRPVIFVAHSFGGIVIKDLLREALKHPQYKQLCQGTLGIVFFSTPHLGVAMAEFLDTFGIIARGTDILQDCLPTSSHLVTLNKEFPVYAPNAATLSFGEGKKMCYPSPYTCWMVVEPHSANPNFDGKQHTFIPLPYADHREVCKPISREDERYARVLSFIVDHAQNGTVSKWRYRIRRGAKSSASHAYRSMVGGGEKAA